MFKMSIIRNQKGAGMYMAMMAAAALGAAGFMMGDMFINAEDVIRKDSRVISYQLLVDTVRKNLYASNNCTNSLAATSPERTGNTLKLVKNALGQFTSAPMDVVNLANILDFAAEKASNLPYNQRGVELLGLPVSLDNQLIVLEKNWKAKTGTGIKSMRLFIDDADGSQDVLMEPPPYTGVRRVRYPTNPTNFSSATVDNYAVNMYLVIEPDHGGVNVWLPENKKYWIKIFAYVNAATNQISSCYDPTSEAAFCTDTMNGVYVNDPSIDASMRCRPDVGCFTYKGGVLPSTTACPPAPYTSTEVSTTMKICSWCPAAPYAASTNTFIQGVDGDGMDVFDQEGDDGPEIDCSKANPWSGLGAREAYEDFLEYWTLIKDLPPDEQALYAGCVNNPPPCFDFPETCANECGGAPKCSCASTRPDDYQTTPGIDPSLAGPATPCYDECTKTNNASCATCDSTCFIAGTQITMSDGSTMAIEDVLKGEDVKDGSYKTRNVSKLWKLPYKGNIYGINGGRHFFTPNHPFMTVDGWKSLAPAVSMKEIPGIKVTMLKVGDILVKRAGLEVIYSLDSTYVNDYVYNITVDDTHEYFADDYLVHNVAAKDPGIDCIEP